MFGAFANLNSEGKPVNIASATPTLDTYQLLAKLTVVALTPEDNSQIFRIEDSEFYGLGAGSTNRLSGFFVFTLDQPAIVNIYVDNILQRQYSLGAGNNRIAFNTPGSEVNIAFGSEIYVKLVRDGADAELTNARFVIYQAS